MTSHEETRINRMRELKETRDALINNRTWSPESKEKMIAVACMKWGTTRRKILEYLKIVELV